MLYNAATNNEIINGTENLNINFPKGSRSKKVLSFMIKKIFPPEFFKRTQKKCASRIFSPDLRI